MVILPDDALSVAGAQVSFPPDAVSTLITIWPFSILTSPPLLMLIEAFASGDR